MSATIKRKVGKPKRHAKSSAVANPEPAPPPLDSAADPQISHAGSGPLNVSFGSGQQTNSTQFGGTNNQQYNAETINIVDKKEALREIADWLSPADPWTNHATARRDHVARTGTWLLLCDKYSQWKTCSTRHLWLHGKPGSGKTVLCSTVIHDLHEYCGSSPDVALAMFYFSFSDGQKQTYDDLLRSLLAQLGWREPALSLLREAHQRPNRVALTPTEMEDILCSSIKSYSCVYIVLDALDECPTHNDARQILLEGIGTLVRRASNLKILATSRYLEDIRLHLDDLRFDQVPIADREVDLDIREYLSTSLKENPVLRDFDSTRRTEIEQKIAEKSGGMFRYAQLQLQNIKKLGSRSPSKIRDKLNQLPAGLDDTYARILNELGQDERKIALVLLRWLAYATRPLTLVELVETVIIDTVKCEVDPEDRGGLEDVLRILPGFVTLVRDESDETRHKQSDWRTEPVGHTDDGNIIQDSRPLVPEDRIRLAHFTVKEYLESSRIPAQAVEFQLERTAGHYFLMQSCVTYLLHYSQTSEKESGLSDLTTFPLLQYAGVSWFDHARMHQRADVSLEMKFLGSDPALRAWLSIYDPCRPAYPFHGDVLQYPAIYCACHLNLQAVVAQLLHLGADVNAQGGSWGNALHVASFFGYEKVVEMLLAKGADVNAVAGEYGTALQAASWGGYEKVVGMLLAKGADINAVAGHYGTALQAASVRGYEEIVGMLLAKGADVNAVAGYYGTALQAASRRGYEKIVGRLLAKGADVNVVAGYHGTALQAASRGGHEKVVEMLLAKGAGRY